MAREKVTITVERAKLAEARGLIDAPTNSAAIDVALTRLIALERLRGDVPAYRDLAPTEEEAGVASIEPSWADLNDDTDWEALYGADR